MKRRFVLIWAILTLLLVLVSTAILGENIEIRRNNIENEKHIAELQAENAALEVWTSFYDDYLELLDEIHQREINEAILQERIVWLETENQGLIYDYVFANQMYDDCIILFDEMESYARGGCVGEFWEQFEAEYPDVYARIGQYDELF